MLSDAGTDSGTHSILLDKSQRVSQASTEALGLLDRCFPGEVRPSEHLPQSLEEWVRNRMARLDGDVPSLDTPLRDTPLRKRTADGADVTIRLLRGTITGSQWLLILQESLRDRTLLERYRLSNREKEVMTEVMRGLSSAEIASILVVSRRTVEKHLESIYNKLGVDSRSAAVAKVLALSLS